MKNGLTLSIYSAKYFYRVAFFSIAGSLCERMDLEEFDPYGRLAICQVKSSKLMPQSVWHQRGNRIKIEQNYIML
jgi:hypothetical protein